MNYMKTVDKVEINRFMGDWFVIAGRFTIFEKGAHNGIERYIWNEKKNRIDISYIYNKNDFDGPEKVIGQKGWIYNEQTKAHWKVQPLWPFKLDYLVIALAPDYSWTAVGVPSGEYLWIMARDKFFSKEKVNEVLKELEVNGYPVNDIKYVPQR